MVRYPCTKDCKFRHKSCHNESCPLGWSDYERGYLEEKRKDSYEKAISSKNTEKYRYFRKVLGEV